jgi:superfamily I DNA/RNA helicase
VNLSGRFPSPGGFCRPGMMWQPADGGPPAIGIAVPERRLMSEVETYLNDHGVPASTIGADGPRRPDVVHIGTLHRFKGLEYQRMIVADVGDGVLPATRIAALKDSDPLRYEREIKQARSLLFVAATRARDSLVISWHGTPSPFLSGARRG